MRNRLGYVYGFGAYVSWGIFPLFFSLLTAVNAFEIIPFRVISCMLFCVVLVTVTRKWPSLARVFKDRRSLFWFTVSALLLYANWQIFVIGVVTGRIIETALGYFMNPLVTILIGVLIRRERLRPAQWVSVGIAFAGVIVSAVVYGVMPWIALGLAFSFGLYGSVRKIANERVDAITSLTIETIVSTPVALIQLVIVWALAGGAGMDGAGFFEHGAWIASLLVASGPVTAIPLILFGAGNRRLKLTHMGFMQFLTPILSFITGYVIFGEPMPLSRWLGFIAVWIAIAVLLSDMVAHSRASSRNHRRKL